MTKKRATLLNRFDYAITFKAFLGFQIIYNIILSMTPTSRNLGLSKVILNMKKLTSKTVILMIIFKISTNVFKTFPPHI